MLCIIAPEYESADDERERSRSADDSADSDTETGEDAASDGDFPTVGTV
ncbi:hypothetical protein [Halosimplex amylolyticum]